MSALGLKWVNEKAGCRDVIIEHHDHAATYHGTVWGYLCDGLELWYCDARYLAYRVSFMVFLYGNVCMVIDLSLA